MGKLVKFERSVNGVTIEQRAEDGFINGTAMCVAHSKDISDWLKNDDTWDMVVALADDLGVTPKCHKSGNSVFTRVSATYPSLVIVRRGSPDKGGGTWLHPDLAIYLAQWCNKPFAIQVSRWVREWLMTGRNPIDVDWEKEWVSVQQRYDLRVHLKDCLRPELMMVVVDYAVSHHLSPQRLCAGVHDAMNERIQGYKSKDLKAFGGLPIGVLLRDYFEASPLVDYSAINRLAKNLIKDKGLEPIQAVHEACDSYLGSSYQPQPVRITENVYRVKQRVMKARDRQSVIQGKQLSLFDTQAS